MAIQDKSLPQSAQSQIAAAQQSWTQAQAAGDQAGMQAAHAAAESVRSSYGYSGGASGSEYITPSGVGAFGPQTSSNSGSSLGGSSQANMPNTAPPPTPAPANPTPQITAQTPTATSGTGFDPEIQSMINQLKEAQKASRIAGLTSAMNSSLSSLDTEQAGVKDTFYNAKNQAGANADVGQYNFAQYMASKGIKGNAGGMPELYRNVGLQNQLGALGQQEAQANTGIENRRSTIKTNYATDAAAAESDVESQALENFINQMNTDRTYQQQQKQYLDQQLSQQKQEYANNIGAYSNDFKAQEDKVQNDGDTSNDWQIPYLQAARAQKLQSMQAAQSASEEKASALQTAQQQAAFENALNAFKVTGQITSQQQADILGIPIGSRTADYDIAKIQAALAAKKATQTGSPGTQNTYPAIYSAMKGSADPAAWLNENAPYMTNDELKYAQSLIP